MEIFIKLSQFLLSLSLLIVLHELGHFIPARLFKTRVEKFYLFFDPKFSLLKKKIGETEYGIGWIPLGGYVKISGMVDESMDTEQLALPPQPWEFRSKPAWQRLIIMLGGVTVNFLLAFLIYIGVTYAYGDFYLQNSELKDGVWVTNQIMEDAGFKTGDKILAVDGKKIERFDGTINEKILTGHSVTVSRDGRPMTLQLPQNFIGRFTDSDKEILLSPRMPFVVGGFTDDSPNKDLVKTKDIILAMDGQPIRYFDQVAGFLQSHKSQTIQATVMRDDKKVPVNLVVNAEGKLGIAPGMLTEENLERLGYYHFRRENYSFLESIPIGIDRGQERLAGYGKQLKAIFTPSTGAYKGVGGFKAIFDIFPRNWSWEAFWNITALLSIMLGVLNLLPIPALDGGHVMFLLYEMITRRKPSDKFMEYAQMAGIAILLCLVLYANGNDIYRAVFHK